MRTSVPGRWLILLVLAAPAAAQEPPAGVDVRIATWDVQGIRTKDLATPDHPRLKHLAEVLQRLRPNIILLNRITYDTPGAPDVKPGETPGLNAQRFVDLYLAVPQAEGLAPLRYRAFTAPVNSGMASGMDLDRGGSVVTEYPAPGSPGTAADAARYSGDCWGYGLYPGHEGMALLLDERLAILADKARTFRRFPWDYMPAALLPKAEDGSPTGLTEKERAIFRLSSASHWDVPVKLPDGSLLHILCSQPGVALAAEPGERQRLRTADEIRFWTDYTDGEPYFVDDSNGPGGADPDAPFVILGNLGLPPGTGEPATDPVHSLLHATRRVNSAVTPTSDLSIPGLDPTATSARGRCDYILPSSDLGIVSAGIWRHGSPDRPFPSDHYPTWMEVRIVPPAKLP